MSKYQSDTKYPLLVDKRIGELLEAGVRLCVRSMTGSKGTTHSVKISSKTSFLTPYMVYPVGGFGSGICALAVYILRT